MNPKGFNGCLLINLPEKKWDAKKWLRYLQKAEGFLHNSKLWYENLLHNDTAYT